MAEEIRQEGKDEQEQVVIRRATTEHVSAHTVEIHQGGANMVHADEDVNIRQGGAKEIRAQNVTIRQGGAMTIDAEKVDMVQGGVGLVRAGEANLGPGTRSAVVLADTVKLEQAGTQFMLARDTVEMDQSGACLLVGRHITAKDSGALIVFADSVEGDIKAVMDRDAAIAFGAALGAMLGLLLAVFGLLRRKS